MTEETVRHGATEQRSRTEKRSPLLRFSVALCVTVLSVSSVTSAPVGAHANSVSYAEYVVNGRAIHAVVRLPLDDVDLLLRLDRDLDGRVSDAELETAAAAVRLYLGKHIRIVANGVPLTEAIERVALWHDDSAFPFLEANLSYGTARAIDQLSIHTDLLTELYPSHKTLARVSAAGRDDRFTFDRSATYERRIASDRATTVAMIAGGAAVVALLWLGRRRTAVLTLAIVLAAMSAEADVIMSATGLNASLKTMERLKRQANAGATRAEALFQLGTEADSLASLMNLEVESHGMQERALLDLALDRTKELGIAVTYNRDKKKFFYDGAAFAEYLKDAPRGTHAAAAEFKLLSYRFYRSSATDIAAVTDAAGEKKGFLARHPRFPAAAEVRLYLAVDYRDLHRRSLERHDGASAEKWRRLARAECLRIGRQFPQTEQADVARQLLQTLTVR